MLYRRKLIAYFLRTPKSLWLTKCIVPFENATLDSEGGYIGPNATDFSLDSIEAKVTSLHNVPGYRLTVNCTPTTLIKNSIKVYANLVYVQLFSSANMTPAVAAELNVTHRVPYDTTSMRYQWTGNPKDYFYDVSMQFDFPSFDTLRPESFTLIHLAGYAGMPDGSNYTSPDWIIPTAWGDLSPIFQNITIPDFSPGRTSNCYAYGADSYTLQCVLLRQEGFLEYKRRDDQTWFITGSNFHSDQIPVKSLLEGFQTILFLGHPAPPLGDVLWGTTTNMKVCNQLLNLDRNCIQYKNFTTAVNNFVYASGEATRIVYNVAAVNASREKPNYFYNVTGEIDRQFYRITYVPVLMPVALLGIIISALLVTVLVITTLGTLSWKMFRQVDITRLVVDCVGADLAKNGPDFTRLGRASDDELSKWAERYRVSYEKLVDVQDDDGDEP